MPDNKLNKLKEKLNKEKEAKKQEVINNYINSTRQAESSNNPNAKNQNSSATGLFQFTKSTWQEMEKHLGKKLDIFSPKDQEVAMKAYTKQNADILEKNNIAVTPANLYSVHVLGKTGGPKFLKKLQQNPNESASKYASDSAVKANQNLFYKNDTPVSAAELYNNLSSKVTPQDENETNDNVQEESQEQFQPNPEFNNTEIDSTRTQQPDVPQEAQIKRSKPLSLINDNSTQQTENNPVEQRRLSLGLSGNNFDFLPKDINLAFADDQAQSEQEQEDNINVARDGGNMKNKNKQLGKNPTEGLLNEFNEGGTHEENSYGGIPQGQGNNGKLNTVEQGETKFNNYVFSDTLKVSDNDVESLFLPKQLANKTFAEASKYINNFLKENPNDRILKKTINKQLDSLTLGNEKARLAKEKLDLNLGDTTKEYNLSGQDLTDPNQMYLGGLDENDDQYQSNVNGLQQGVAEGNNTQSENSPYSFSMNQNKGNSAMSSIGQGLSGLGDGLSAMKHQDNFYDPVEGEWAAKEKGVGGIKDSVASAIGPWGELFRGIEKAGGGLGDAIGGDVGTGISSAFSPDEAVMKNNQDPDSTTWEKIGGIFNPIGAGINTANHARERQKKLSLANSRRLNSAYDDKYEMGGFLNKFENGGKKKNKDNYSEGTIDDDQLTKQLALEREQYYDSLSTPIELTPAELDNKNERLSGYSDPGGAINKTKLDRYSAKPKNYMQYAPVLGDFMNMIDANKAKPEVESLDRSTQRYQPQYTDEAYLQNISNNSFDNTISALTNASGGSAAALRANILGADINRASSLSDAYFKGNQANQAENRAGQSFNAQTNQFNIGQSDREKEINAANRAVVEDRRNLTRDAFYKDLGGIGREQTYDNRLQNLTGGYDSMGNYNKDDLAFLEDYFKNKKDSNEKKMGGFLSTAFSAKPKPNKAEQEFNNRYK